MCDWGGWLWSDVDVGILGDWLWNPPASSSLSFLFVNFFLIILIKLSFSLLLSGCKRNCAFMI